MPQRAFSGRTLWLRIQASGQSLSPRQELLAVPCALSLRRGATISGPGAPHVRHTSAGYPIEAWSQGNIGVLATSGVTAALPAPSGMHGLHTIGDGEGVYGSGAMDGVDGESTANNTIHDLTTSDTRVIYDVALAGRVYCDVDAAYGEVLPGDLVTTSPTPGYARR